MEFDWDPAKAAANVAKHGIQFEEAIRVFADPDHIVEDSTRPEFGEERLLAVGQVTGVFITTIFTNRSGACRIISARRACRHERARYRQSQTAT